MSRSHPDTTNRRETISLRRVTMIYLLALGLIAILAIVTHMLVDSIVERQQETAHVVNMSGRQRMLSQRIAEMTLEASVYPKSRPTLEPQLRAAIGLMQTSHRALITTTMDASQAAIYNAAPYHLNARVEMYLGLARDFLSAPPDSARARTTLSAILTQAHGPILSALDAAVTQYERNSEAAIHRLRLILMMMLAAMLATLAAEAIWIFRPLFRRLGENRRALITAAQTDPLTGCMNRRHLIDMGERTLAHCRRQDMPLAVLLLDIDHFKAINDQFGHAAGDSAIKTFTQALLSRMRRSDMLGRIGGEEFVMLLPGTDQAGAMATAERLRADVETAEVAGEQAAIGLTVSIGVACCQAQDDSILTAIDRADRAMYQAKNSGRNRVATLEHPSPGCPGYLDTMPR